MTAHAVPRSTAESTLINQFEAQRELSPSPERAAAFKRFAERGLPTRRVESWHYTDLRAAMIDAAPLAPSPDRTAIENGAPDAGRSQEAWSSAVGFAQRAPHRGPERQNARRRGDRRPRRQAGDRGRSHGRADRGDEPGRLRRRGVGRRRTRRADRDPPHRERRRRAFALFSHGDRRSAPARARPSSRPSRAPAPPCSGTPLRPWRSPQGAALKHAVVVEDKAELHLESQVIELEAGAELNAFALVSGGTL